MSTLSTWMKEAEKQGNKAAKRVTNTYGNVVSQLTAAKENQLGQIDNQEQNALYNINSQKSTINQTAEDNAKQANINRVLALKENQQAMNRAGLGTQGIVGSQVNAVNNSYGSNLNAVLNAKMSSLNDLEKNKNDVSTQYNNNRLNVEESYATNLANLKRQIDQEAQAAYETAYYNYLNMKQQQKNSTYTYSGGGSSGTPKNNNNNDGKFKENEDPKVVPVQTPTEVGGQTQKNSSPLLSAKAMAWYNSNIASNLSKEGKISTNTLVDLIGKGLSLGQITQQEKINILRFFGLY